MLDDTQDVSGQQLIQLLHSLTLSEWDVLFSMRHHGVYTRLLDWTEVLGVALYFTVCKVKTESNAALWLLIAHRLNTRSTQCGCRDLVAPPYVIVGRNDVKYSEFLVHPAGGGMGWDLPIGLYPVQRNSRLFAQRGYFTMHGRNPAPLDESCSEYVRKIEIPPDLIPPIKHFLEVAGITEYSLFPDLVGLGRQLNSDLRTRAATFG
jgi:hypothetical protein